MAKYYCILFDADNTLLDFDAAESKALAALSRTPKLSRPTAPSTKNCGVSWKKASSAATS